MKQCAAFRYEMGGRILKIMDENNELPIANIDRLAKTMMEYYKTQGLADELKEAGYKWRPSREYWIVQLRDVREMLREEGRFFEFCPFEGSVQGMWKFVTKKEYKAILARARADLATRVDTFNDRAEAGNLKWNTNVAPIPEVRLLE